jgi:hypothetical protein
MWIYGRFLVGIGGVLPVGVPKTRLDVRGVEWRKNLKWNLAEYAELRGFLMELRWNFPLVAERGVRRGLRDGNSGAVVSTKAARE